MKIFAERMKELRKKKGLNLKETAGALGISVSTLVRYENNICEPTFNKAIEITIFFDVDADYLFGMIDDYKDKRLTNLLRFCISRIRYKTL